MAFKLSKNSRENLVGVDSDLIQVIEDALKITKIDFGIPAGGGFRTVEQQQYMYNMGASQLDGINKKSRHQSGQAFDVFAYVDGAASWKKEHLTHVAAAVLQAASNRGIVLEWGGFWRAFEDMPHFQRVE